MLKIKLNAALKPVLALTMAALLGGVAIADSPKADAKKAKAEVKLTEVKVCPMMLGAVDGEGSGSEVVGKYKVYFCCAGCQPAFDKLSKKEKDAKIATALKKQTDEKKTQASAKLTEVNICPISMEAIHGKGVGSEVVGKYNVNFCCAGCQPAFDKLSAEEKDKKIAAALKKQQDAK